ncbi:MAG: type II toxin-antitoxin system death-on-curing family toxin [Candidatus Helarchaeota archaeon]
MTWIPTIEYIIHLADELIKSSVIMNRAGLISTLDKVTWGIPTQGLPTIWDQVSILFKEIVEQHYFSDGNKRIGIIIAYIFLKKNGYDFSPPKGEIFSVTMAVAQGQKSYEEIKAWFIENSKKA